MGVACLFLPTAHAAHPVVVLNGFVGVCVLLGQVCIVRVPSLYWIGMVFHVTLWKSACALMLCRVVVFGAGVGLGAVCCGVMVDVIMLCDLSVLTRRRRVDL